jgi:hypothetical protein
MIAEPGQVIFRRDGKRVYAREVCDTLNANDAKLAGCKAMLVHLAEGFDSDCELKTLLEELP